MSGPAQRTVKFVPAPGIKESFRKLKKTNPEIKDSMTLFNQYKKEIPPLSLPLSMKDHRLNPPLNDYRECHLSDDILLLYTHKGNVVTLLKICNHDDIHGKRGQNLQKTLKFIQSQLH